MKPTTKIRFTEPQIVLLKRAYPKCNLDYLTELSFESMPTTNATRRRLASTGQREDRPPADPRRCHPKSKVGILAFGSLNVDPGDEILPTVFMWIRMQTPFPVEYGRLSLTRGGAPTLVPHPKGAPVAAQVLVLENSISVDEARNMLWRRERRRIGSGEAYVEGNSPNSVLVRTFNDHPCVETIHYTDFHPTGKISHPSSVELAQCAIESVKKAEAGKDGISYLIRAIASGIETPLSKNYVAEIQRLTGTVSLSKALEKLVPKLEGHRARWLG
jgi:hypothetical protein